jgi:hypothetical protein
VLQLVAVQPVQEAPPPAEDAVSFVPTLALQALISLAQLGFLHSGHSTSGSLPNTSFSKSKPQSLQ